MTTSSTVAVAIVSGVLMLAPGVMTGSFAATRTHRHYVGPDRSRDFKALGSEDATGRTSGYKQWPGVPGIAPPEDIVPTHSMYSAPRGGREY
jgi:hypothetical protein